MHPALGKEGFGASYAVSKPHDEEKGPAVVFADGTQTIFTADMSGDGLTDLVRIRNGEVCYWPNLGFGRFGAKVTMASSPLFDRPDRFDPRRIRLADIDGSGTTDLFYLDSGGVRYWLNEAGNGFGSEQRLPGFPPTNNLSSVAVFDLRGDGTSCLVWSSPLPSERRSPLRYVELTGGIKPHLLSRIESPLGSTTVIEYAPSTRFYLEDRKAGKPWITKLPFPVQVAAKITVEDAISQTKLVTRYAYHHGYYDGPEREFRGFGMVEQWDAEDLGTLQGQGDFPGDGEENLYVPPIYTKTWFHTGAYLSLESISRQYAKEYYAGDSEASALDDSLFLDGLTPRERREALRALRGKELRQEIYADDGNPAPYQVTEQRYQIKKLQSVAEKRYGVFAVYPLETLQLHYERNPADPRTTHEAVLEVNDYGEVTKSASLAYPRRAAHTPEGAPAAQSRVLATYTEKRFAHKPSELDWYRVNAPIETRIYEIPGLSLTDEKPLSLTQLAAIPAYAEKRFDESAALGDKRLIGHDRTYYYDDALAETSLDLGEIGRLGLVYQAYRMAFPDTLVETVYDEAIDSTQLTDAGYHAEDDAAWLPSGISTFDADAFYQPIAFQDPWGNTTTQSYDDYALLVEQVTDPVGNVISVANDYRQLQAWQLTDPNDNVTRIAFDPLGRVVKLALCGKITLDEDEDEVCEGDTLAAPTERFEYHFAEWATSQKPNFVYHAAREVHGDGTVDTGANAPWQRSYHYFDGMGRTVAQKAQAEPGDAWHLVDGEPVKEYAASRWVGTGRTVYDNKGNPVKQYEPFFSFTSEYEDEAELVEWGVTPILHYDPLGRLVKTQFPDGTLSRIAFTAWEQATWDQNDTSGEAESVWRKRADQDAAEQRATALTLQHRGTPKRERLDPLGRVVEAIEDNTLHEEAAAEQPDGSVSTDPPDPERLYTTHFELDIQGNAVRIIDHRAATSTPSYATLEQRFDMTGRSLHQTSCDAGESWLFADVAGKPIWSKEARGFEQWRSYDALRRLAQVEVNQPDESRFVAERTVYGDDPAIDELGGDFAHAKSSNLRGRVYQQYDASGVVTHAAYDFKGNLLSTSRQLLVSRGSSTDSALPEAQRVTDWTTLIGSGSPSRWLDPFVTATTYDALNRPVVATLPARSPASGTSNRQRFSYSRRGTLDAVDVWAQKSSVWQSYVATIEHNEKGQRSRIAYGNDVVTAYEYDPKTFRLKQLHSDTGSGTDALQDLTYTYDAVGNIAQIDDAAQQTVYFANAAVSASQKFAYDSLYRLKQAEGREHIGQSGQPTQPDSTDAWIAANIPDPGDSTALARYKEKYAYDEIGNITSMGHYVPDSAMTSSWTRSYTYASDSNRLATTTNSGGSISYTHDDAGNMVSMPHLQSIVWDHAGRMVRADQGTSRYYYTYDAAGERVRKLTVNVVTDGDDEVERVVSHRAYLGGYELYLEGSDLESGTDPTTTLERETLHVMDGERRCALVETKLVDTANSQSLGDVLSRYQLDNHLGSVAVEFDDEAHVISYEEYHPYGTSAYRARCDSALGDFEAKRYRYTGKERDEGTGFSYHSARYYVPWLGRWCSADPAGLVDGMNRYAYAKGNPVNLGDPSGYQSQPHNDSEVVFAPQSDVEFTHQDVEEHPDAHKIIVTSPSDRASSVAPANSVTQSKNSEYWNKYYAELEKFEKKKNEPLGIDLMAKGMFIALAVAVGLGSGLAGGSTLTASALKVGGGFVGSGAAGYVAESTLPRTWDPNVREFAVGGAATIGGIAAGIGSAKGVDYFLPPKELVVPTPGLSGTSRAGSALKVDSHHAFPDIVDNSALAGDAVRFEIPTRGAGGEVVRTSELFQVEGSLNGRSGVFEWIVDQGVITHRRFIPGGTATGFPNQAPGR